MWDTSTSRRSVQEDSNQWKNVTKEHISLHKNGAGKSEAIQYFIQLHFNCKYSKRFAVKQCLWICFSHSALGNAHHLNNIVTFFVFCVNYFIFSHFNICHHRTVLWFAVWDSEQTVIFADAWLATKTGRKRTQTDATELKWTQTQLEANRLQWAQMDENGL